MKTILSGSIFNSGIATLGTLLFVPHRIGKEKHKKTTTVNLPIFDQVSFLELCPNPGPAALWDDP
jgi:hypothetical protein